jgi:hypothetical protein
MVESWSPAEISREKFAPCEAVKSIVRWIYRDAVVAIQHGHHALRSCAQVVHQMGDLMVYQCAQYQKRRGEIVGPIPLCRQFMLDFQGSMDFREDGHAHFRCLGIDPGKELENLRFHEKT